MFLYGSTDIFLDLTCQFYTHIDHDCLMYKYITLKLFTHVIKQWTQCLFGYKKNKSQSKM